MDGDVTIVGTCGICGGAVAIQNIWHGTQRQRPKCLKCGACAKEDYGKVIKMERSNDHEGGNKKLIID